MERIGGGGRREDCALVWIIKSLRRYVEGKS